MIYTTFGYNGRPIILLIYRYIYTEDLYSTEEVLFLTKKGLGLCPLSLSVMREGPGNIDNY